MQKPKNLLPGLFLCVFSRTAEPLVDFIAVIFGFFPFFIWGRLFLPERKVFPSNFIQALFIQAPFIQAHFAHRFHKKLRARRAFTSTRLYLACRRDPRKAPLRHAPNRLKTILLGPCTANLALFTHTKGPTQKTPGVIPGVWLMKNSFNLRLTHCGRFLAGCTGPACSRRPQ